MGGATPAPPRMSGCANSGSGSARTDVITKPDSPAHAASTQVSHQAAKPVPPADKDGKLSNAAKVLTQGSARSHMILAGLGSGVTVAGLFNPWDRALYLSVLHNRHFLDRRNFAKPYQGFWQALFHRTLSGGLYFPLFDMAQPVTRQGISVLARAYPAVIDESEQSALLHFVCGNIAGGTSGVLLNGLTAVKYDSWNTHKTFFATARSMWRAGGIHPFTKGIGATVTRDTCFGGVFALTKFQLSKWFQPYIRLEDVVEPPPVSKSLAVVLHTHPAMMKGHTDGDACQQRHAPQDGILPPQAKPAPSFGDVLSSSHSHEDEPVVVTVSPGLPMPRIQFSARGVDFTAALLSGLLATTISSPFNYVRNIKYGWPAEMKPPTSTRILIDLMAEAKASGRMMWHLQERLRVGWGTARVAVGMATGQFLYEMLKRGMDEGQYAQRLGAWMHDGKETQTTKR